MDELKELSDKLLGDSPAVVKPEGVYKLPLKVGKAGQPLDSGDGTTGDKPWIIGTFIKGGPAWDNKHNGVHLGVDVAGPKGEPVYPIGPGTVIEVKDYPKGGHTCKVQHDPDSNLISYYAHMDSVSVSVGQKVDSNTQLGTNGNTGNASDTHAHVHFQTKLNGSDVDPMSIIGKPIGSFVKVSVGKLENLVNSYCKIARLL